MSTIRSRHECAMQCVDKMFASRRRADLISANTYLARAFVLEQDAFFKAIASDVSTRTKVTLLESAAGLGATAKRFSDVRKLFFDAFCAMGAVKKTERVHYIGMYRKLENELQEQNPEYDSFVLKMRFNSDMFFVISEAGIAAARAELDASGHTKYQQKRAAFDVFHKSTLNGVLISSIPVLEILPIDGKWAVIETLNRRHFSSHETFDEAAQDADKILNALVMLPLERLDVPNPTTKRTMAKKKGSNNP